MTYQVSIYDGQMEPALLHAIREIKGTYGVDVNLKYKTLIKYGRFDFVGASRVTVQGHGGNETYTTDNTIAYMSSSDADAVDMVIEGHTIDGSGNFR